MGLLFEWDASKARTNFRKHGIRFEDAASVFGDPNAITIESKVPSGERRLVTIGKTKDSELIVVVVHTDRNYRIRIISARRASRAERRQYQRI